MVDFARISQIEHAIKHDHGGRIYKGRSTEPLASPNNVLLPASWVAKMKTILDLPVSEHVVPVPVAGEIDTELLRGERHMAFGNKGAAAPTPAAATPPIQTKVKSEQLDGIMAKLDSIEKHGAHLGDTMSKLATTIRDGLAALNDKLDQVIVLAGGEATAAAPPPPAAGAKGAGKRPTPAAAAPAEEAVAPAAPAGDLDEAAIRAMNRKQLVDLAPSWGIDHNGHKREELIALFLEKLGGGGGQAAAPAPAAKAAVTDKGAYLTVVAGKKATVLMKLLEDNWEVAAPYVETEPSTQVEGAMLCGGDCARCPNPEGYPTPSDQVASCFEGLHAMLGVPVPAVA
jgi:hypothetical protein